jgi:hypothetical protein
VVVLTQPRQKQQHIQQEITPVLLKRRQIMLRQPMPLMPQKKPPIMRKQLLMLRAPPLSQLKQQQKQSGSGKLKLQNNNDKLKLRKIKE